MGEWGTTKGDYYNADAIETEADALEEENEVRRLQRKQLERLTEEDFGLDELAWAEGAADDVASDRQGSEDGVIREFLPEPQIDSSIGPEERLKILRIRYPEFEPLSKEFIDLQSTFTDLALVAEPVSNNGQLELPVTDTESLLGLKHRTLGAYLGALSMYFVLLTSTHADAGTKITAMAPMKLRDHSIMNTLFQCRQLWEKVKDIPSTEMNNQKPLSGSKEVFEAVNKPFLPAASSADIHDNTNEPKETPRKPRKSKTQKALEAAQALETAQRVERMDKSLRAFSALETQIGNQSKKAPAPRGERSPSHSSFGEQTTLNENEALEKSQRNKSLRFYTSQITQKSQKRDAASRYAGGDTDIPHRERLRDRQARLNAEAESRGKSKRAQNNKTDALGGESDDEDRQTAAELRQSVNKNASPSDDDDETNPYYDFLSAQQSQKKAARKAAAAAAGATTTPRIEEDQFEGGKRGLSYAIAKNKGLAPRRKKEVRNPRVKKRLKFEEKKRKLGSVRAVWKGGEGKGGYKGELTGIKTGLVKGIRL